MGTIQTRETGAGASAGAERARSVRDCGVPGTEEGGVGFGKGRETGFELSGGKYEEEGEGEDL
jgi:hypothetical protein